MELNELGSYKIAAGVGRRRNRTLAAALAAFITISLCQAATPAESFHTYVGRIGSDSFLLAWGTTAGGGNTIGRHSRSAGTAEIEVAGRKLHTNASWIEVQGLASDTDYPYSLRINGELVGEGRVRTVPRSTRKLSFMVIGDYGNGSESQYAIADAMRIEMERRANSDNPVRFVLTTGDNIYSTRVLGVFPKSTGLHDRDWREKFFLPYQALLKSIPFYPTLGNHDMKMAHRRDGGEVGTYLDNFFFPVDTTQRYYSFAVGGFVEFFALDSNTMSVDETSGDLGPNGKQYQWLAHELAVSRAPWKIAYFHHPPFSAGPTHHGNLKQLQSIMNLFSRYKVQVVFSGHEHNFQVSQRNLLSGRTQYIVSGAGGQLRSRDIVHRMAEANIAAIARQRHFLLVEIDNQKLSITPLAAEPVDVRDSSGNKAVIPVEVMQ